MPQTTNKIVKEQATIENEADVVQRSVMKWLGEMKAFMLAKSDLPYGKWKSEVLKKARKDLSVLERGMVASMLNTSWTINKSDDLEAKNILKKDAIKINKTQHTAGVTNPQMARNVRLGAVSLFTKEIIRSNSQGLGNRQIADAVIGTRSQNYKNGVMRALVNSSRTVMTTGAKGSVEAMREDRYKATSGVIGYVWISVLDEVTSSTCMGLNAKEFYYTRNGRKLSGFKPLPPMHPNCRSTTQPIEEGGDVPEVETFNEWLKNNPKEVEEALGPTQFKVLQSGQLKIERFTDARFKPLTVEQVKDQL